MAQQTSPGSWPILFSNGPGPALTCTALVGMALSLWRGWRPAHELGEVSARGLFRRSVASEPCGTRSGCAFPMTSTRDRRLFP